MSFCVLINCCYTSNFCVISQTITFTGPLKCGPFPGLRKNEKVLKPLRRNKNTARNPKVSSTNKVAVIRRRNSFVVPAREKVNSFSFFHEDLFAT